MKIDAVDPWAAADNPHPHPGHNGQVYATLQPPKPRQIVRVGRNVDACPILPHEAINTMNESVGALFNLFCIVSSWFFWLKGPTVSGD